MSETNPVPAVTAADIDKKTEEHITKVLELATVKVEYAIKELQTKQGAEKELKKNVQRGKPLREYLDFTSFYSTQASGISRNLALAGIGVIWLFKYTKETNTMVRGLLNSPLFCLIISLSIDLLQYLIAYIAWRVFYEIKYYKWAKRKFEPTYVADIEAPNYISLTIDFLFLIKISFMIVAYYKIGLYVFSLI